MTTATSTRAASRTARIMSWLLLVASLPVAGARGQGAPLGGDAARRLVAAHRGGPLVVDATAIDAAAAASSQGESNYLAVPLDVEVVF